MISFSQPGASPNSVQKAFNLYDVSQKTMDYAVPAYTSANLAAGNDRPPRRPTYSPQLLLRDCLKLVGELIAVVEGLRTVFVTLQHQGLRSDLVYRGRLSQLLHEHLILTHWPSKKLFTKDIQHSTVNLSAQNEHEKRHSLRFVSSRVLPTLIKTFRYLFDCFSFVARGRAPAETDSNIATELPLKAVTRFLRRLLLSRGNVYRFTILSLIVAGFYDAHRHYQRVRILETVLQEGLLPEDRPRQRT